MHTSNSGNSEKIDRAAVVSLFFVFSFFILVAMLIPRDGFVLVVGPPGSSEASVVEIVNRANGSYVSGSAISWIGVAYSSSPDFTKSLLASGAYLVTNYALAAGCEGIRE